MDVEEVDELLDVRDVTDSAREIGRIGVGGTMREGRDCITGYLRNVRIVKCSQSLIIVKQ